MVPSTSDVFFVAVVVVPPSVEETQPSVKVENW